MKILYLTGISNIPNEKGEEKIEKANGKKSEGGYSREFFEEMGIKPPKDLEDEPEYDEEGRLILEESDIQEVNVDIAVPVHLFGGCEDLTNGTTVVYTTYGYTFTVEENTDEITSYISYLNLSWFEKQVASFKVFWRKIKNRFEEDSDNLFEN